MARRTHCASNSSPTRNCGLSGTIRRFVGRSCRRNEGRSRSLAFSPAIPCPRWCLLPLPRTSFSHPTHDSQTPCKDSPMRLLYINNDGGGFADQVEVADGMTVAQFFQERVGGKASDYLIR